MTMTTLFLSGDAVPMDRNSHRSLWQLFVDAIAEGRMRKAEHDIAKYLRQSGRRLPQDLRR